MPVPCTLSPLVVLVISPSRLSCVTVGTDNKTPFIICYLCALRASVTHTWSVWLAIGYCVSLYGQLV